MPADSLMPGAYLAQDTRWPAAGKRVISSPVSASIACAATRLIPGTSSSFSAAAAKEAASASIRVSRSAIAAALQ